MKPLGLVPGVVVLIATAGSLPGGASGRFDQKLSKDAQAVHVVNRLTFGARPGDVEEVRRVGVEQWIRLQLRPEQIPDSAVLAARLRPIESLQLATRQLIERYQSPPRVVAPATARPSAVSLLSFDELAMIQTGTADVRRNVLNALKPDTRMQLFGILAPEFLDDIPEFKADVAKARAAENAARQAEQRRLNPQLPDLLTEDQVKLLQGGGMNEEKAKLLASLEDEKRTQVLRRLPPEQVPPAFQREVLRLRQPQQVVPSELVEAKLYRALYSTRQLEEVLADFWLNHFNVFIQKGQVRWFLTSYERDAIRPHVLGRFRDMLLATARHPAMLFYLDNYQSRLAQDESTPSVPRGAPRQGLNENYGRELMELHTLGVDGGYTQADVIAVARAFTGWTINEPNRIGEFQFNPAAHDRAEKVVLGHTLPAGGGEEDGLKVIEILSRHPSTARFISRKLVQRFVADAAPEGLVERMAATFLKTDGDLRAVLETMLLSKEFLSEGAWQAKMKSPLEVVVSSLRGLDAEVTDTTAIAQRIADLGQPLYGKAEPTGYPSTGEAWASSASLLGRLNFAAALAGGQVPGVTIDAGAVVVGDADRIARRLFGTKPSAGTIAALEKGLAAKASAPVLVTVLIASPDFQKR